MKQNIFVFCGADMTGKTEISKEFSKRLGIPYFKASSEHTTFLSKKDQFIQQLRYADPRMVDFLRQTGYSVVFDRGFPCEFAYSRVLGRETDLKALESIDAAFASLGTTIIITQRKSFEGIVDDIDEKIDETTLMKLQDAYVEFGNWTRCRTFYLAVDDENIEREINDIFVGTGLVLEEEE